VRILALDRKEAWNKKSLISEAVGNAWLWAQQGSNLRPTELRFIPYRAMKIQYGFVWNRANDLMDLNASLIGTTLLHFYNRNAIAQF